MRIVGLDLGTKTLGIAMSDSSLKLAFGKETYRFKDRNFDAAFDYIKDYLNAKNIKEVDLGLPLHMNGSMGESANYCLNFKERLEEAGFIVHMVDERLTSVIANHVAAFLKDSAQKRKSRVDQMAATEILQTYLDQKRSSNG